MVTFCINVLYEAHVKINVWLLKFLISTQFVFSLAFKKLFWFTTTRRVEKKCCHITRNCHSHNASCALSNSPKKKIISFIHTLFRKGEPVSILLMIRDGYLWQLKCLECPEFTSTTIASGFFDDKLRIFSCAWQNFAVFLSCCFFFSFTLPIASLRKPSKGRTIWSCARSSCKRWNQLILCLFGWIADKNLKFFYEAIFIKNLN